MSQQPFDDLVSDLMRKEPRYTRGAYLFLREAFAFTMTMRQRDGSQARRHVSASELLEGLRCFALQEYGPMAFSVLASWGLHRSEDIGAVVFNLVESGRLGKNENDRIEDFNDGYDFREAFVRPFLPRGTAVTPRRPALRDSAADLPRGRHAAPSTSSTGESSHA